MKKVPGWSEPTQTPAYPHMFSGCHWVLRATEGLISSCSCSFWVLGGSRGTSHSFSSQVGPQSHLKPSFQLSHQPGEQAHGERITHRMTVPPRDQVRGRKCAASPQAHCFLSGQTGSMPPAKHTDGHHSSKCGAHPGCTTTSYSITNNRDVDGPAPFMLY